MQCRAARPHVVRCCEPKSCRLSLAGHVSLDRRGLSAALRRWILILLGMILLSVSAYGPRRLPTELLLIRRIGIAIFGSVDNLKVLLWLAVAVRHRPNPTHWHRSLGFAHSNHPSGGADVLVFQCRHTSWRASSR